MHKSSYYYSMERFKGRVEGHFKGQKVKILDVGSYGINGTYREIFSDKEKFAYVGLDFNPATKCQPEQRTEFFGMLASLARYLLFKITNENLNRLNNIKQLLGDI